MVWLLNTVYLLLLIIASPWLVWTAWRTGKYREGWRQKLLGWVPVRVGNGVCVWFHAVSVGEVNLLDGLLDELADRRPDVVFVISTTTRTGFAIAREKYSDHLVCYCPLDLSWAVRRAFQRLRPDLVVLVELELWPNLIRAARQRDVPVAVINGRLSEASYRGYGRLRRFVAPMMADLSSISVQNATYAARFRGLGAPAERVSVTGSIKFDNAVTDRGNPRTRQLSEMAGLEPHHQVFLAGSTQSPEEEVALAAFQNLQPRFPDLRLILVPRHPQRFEEVSKLLTARGVGFLRRSQLEQRAVPPAWRVLLVDTVGELGAWWGVAALAFVGGSLGDRGGQNMIEPAAYGAAICFGPNTRNFRDVVATLLRAEAAQVVHNETELAAFLERCLCDAAWAAAIGRRAQSLVVRQRGALSRTVENLEKLLDQQASDRARRTGRMPHLSIDRSY